MATSGESLLAVFAMLYIYINIFFSSSSLMPSGRDSPAELWGLSLHRLHFEPVLLPRNQVDSPAAELSGSSNDDIFHHTVCYWRWLARWDVTLPSLPPAPPLQHDTHGGGSWIDRSPAALSPVLASLRAYQATLSWVNASSGLLGYWKLQRCCSPSTTYAVTHKLAVTADLKEVTFFFLPSNPLRQYWLQCQRLAPAVPPGCCVCPLSLCYLGYKCFCERGARPPLSEEQRHSVMTSKDLTLGAWERASLDWLLTRHRSAHIGKPTKKPDRKCCTKGATSS